MYVQPQSKQIQFYQGTPLRFCFQALLVSPDSSSPTAITMFTQTTWLVPKPHLSVSSIKSNCTLFLPNIRTQLFLSIQLNVLMEPLSHNVITPTAFLSTALIKAILLKLYPFKSWLKNNFLGFFFNMTNPSLQFYLLLTLSTIKKPHKCACLLRYLITQSL